MAAEGHALVQAFDIAYVIRDTLLDLLGGVHVMEAYIDRHTLFIVVTEDGNIAEQCVKMDDFELR